MRCAAQPPFQADATCTILDTALIPTKAAWAVGKRLAEQQIARFKADTGRTLEKLSMVLWYGETARSRGVMEAEAMWLMGVEPRWNARNIVDSLRLVPDAELGRPRVDVLYTVSGIYRDGFGDKILWLDRAARLAASAGDNAISRHDREVKAALMKSGVPEAQAEQAATARVFGAAPGMYGVGGIEQIVSRSLDDGEEKGIADMYLHHMNHAYSEKLWGAEVGTTLTEQLKGNDALVHSRTTYVYGALDNDDFYQFAGGLNAALKAVNGTAPQFYVNNQRADGHERIETFRRFLVGELTTRYWNPKWIREQQDAGYAGARQIIKEMEHLYGFQATSKEQVDGALWQKSYDVYVADEHGLDMDAFFEKANPYVRQWQLARLLEVDRQGSYRFSDAERGVLIDKYVKSVVAHGAACSSNTCGNLRLHQYIAEQAPLVSGLGSQDLQAFARQMTKSTHWGAQQFAGAPASFRAGIVEGLQQAREAAQSRPARPSTPPAAPTAPPPLPTVTGARMEERVLRIAGSARSQLGGTSLPLLAIGLLIVAGVVREMARPSGGIAPVPATAPTWFMHMTQRELQAIQWLRIPGAAALAVLVSVSPLAAQDDTRETKNDTPPIVTVEVVVTGTKTDIAPDKAPVSTSVVSSQELRIRNSQTLDQSLNLLGGLYVLRTKGAADTNTRINMRGFTGANRTLVLLDGQPVNDAYTGEVSWASLPNAEVNRVEVVRGPFSALYGGNAMAGVINILTRPVTRRSGEASAQFGTYGTQNYSGHLAERVGRLGLSVGAQRLSSDGYASRGVATAATTGTTGTRVTGVVPTFTTTGTRTYQIGWGGENWYRQYALRGKSRYSFGSGGMASFQYVRQSSNYGYEGYTSLLRDANGATVDRGPVLFDDGGVTRALTFTPGTFISGPGQGRSNLYSGTFQYAVRSTALVRVTAGICRSAGQQLPHAGRGNRESHSRPRLDQSPRFTQHLCERPVHVGAVGPPHRDCRCRRAGRAIRERGVRAVQLDERRRPRRADVCVGRQGVYHRVVCAGAVSAGGSADARRRGTLRSVARARRLQQHVHRRLTAHQLCRAHQQCGDGQALARLSAHGGMDRSRERRHRLPRTDGLRPVSHVPSGNDALPRRTDVDARVAPQRRGGAGASLRHACLDRSHLVPQPHHRHDLSQDRPGRRSDGSDTHQRERGRGTHQRPRVDRTRAGDAMGRRTRLVPPSRMQ
ncbi:MAG: cobaltochelatase subunit CobN [Vicinamibacterales bacterium]